MHDYESRLKEVEAWQAGYAAGRLEEWLKHLGRKLDHQHSMLHGIADQVAEIAAIVVTQPGGLSPEETAAAKDRLTAIRDRLKGIAAPPATP